MDSKFFDSLYEGDSANGVRLGMGLTGGDFWARPVGCQMLYRGSNMEAIDFAKILAVDEINASRISPPDYVTHEASTTYFYVVHRVNNCGSEEQSLAAAVKIVIDANGDLAAAEPNDVFLVKAGQVEGSKVKLIWFYSPLEQESKPVCFKIYYDSGTGQVDYQNAIATITYVGRKFYSYQTNTLQAGKYLFVARAEDADGMYDGSFAEIGVGVTADSPVAIDILGAQAV
jgi:hypothetical protein